MEQSDARPGIMATTEGAAVPRRNMFAGVESVSELLGQVVGAGSVCWENPGGAGVFDDGQARKVVADAEDQLAFLLKERGKTYEANANSIQVKNIWVLDPD
ncbi:MAG: hypothetical protein ACSLE6_07425 [Mycobacterium sp.]